MTPASILTHQSMMRFIQSPGCYGFVSLTQQSSKLYDSPFEMHISKFGQIPSMLVKSILGDLGDAAWRIPDISDTPFTDKPHTAPLLVFYMGVSYSC